MNQKLYKYHIRLYRLYEVFGDKIFYAGEANEALENSPYLYHSSLTLNGLDRRKYLVTPPRDDVRKQIPRPDYRKHYRRLSLTGLHVAKEIEKNKGLITMFMLRQ